MGVGDELSWVRFLFGRTPAVRSRKQTDRAGSARNRTQLIKARTARIEAAPAVTAALRWRGRCRQTGKVPDPRGKKKRPPRGGTHPPPRPPPRTNYQTKGLGGAGERFVPFGKYWRSRPLVFSFVPRCQGLWGSQKYTFTFVAIVKVLCLDSSCPRSHVSERRNDRGSLRICRVRALTTVTVSRLGTLTSAVKRECRSTKVTLWLFLEPLIRSPFPVTRDGSIFDLRGPLADRDGIRYLAA